MERKINFIISFLYNALWVVIIFVSLRYLFPALFPFVLGFAISYLLMPIIIKIQKRLPKRLSVFFVLIFFYIFAGFIIWFFVYYTATQLLALAGSLPASYAELLESTGGLSYFLSNKVSEIFPEVENMLGIISSITDQIIQTISSTIISSLTLLAANTPLFVTTAFFTVMSSVLISLNYDGVKNVIKAALPKEKHTAFARLANFLKKSVLGLVSGYLLIMLLTFIQLSFGLWLLGVERFAALALLIALLDILPIIGSGVALLPWGVLTLLSGNTFLGWGIIILYAIIACVRNIAEPKIIGDRIGLDPLATITAMYFGLSFGGFVGMFTAPIALLSFIYYIKSEKNE